MALIAALAFNVSKIVSSRKKSTPPWCRAPGLFAIGGVHLIEGHLSGARIIDVC